VSEGRRRLFFALWPSSGVRAGLVERRKPIEGLSKRRVPDHNLHLTLLFLGDQPADRVQDIVSAAAGVQADGFSLVLDRFGWFQGARVAWLGGTAPVRGLTLVAQLAASMRELGLRFDDRPWTPHVTLFRQVRDGRALPAVEPLAWPVNRFELLESVPGRPYEPLASVKLD